MARSSAKTSRRRTKVAAEPGCETVAAAPGVPVEVAAEAPAEPTALPAVASSTVEQGGVDQNASTAVFATCVLASTCSIKEVSALRARLGELVSESAPVTLDASAVERVDTATLQLLFAFVRDRLNADKEIAWTGVTAPFEEAARVLGLRDLLCLPAA